MPPLREQFEGREFDWFAVDVEGKLAHFSTAGDGPVPLSVLEHFVDADSISEVLLSLPEAGEATGHLPHNIEDWLQMARRGIYSYDWKQSSGPDRRAATPEKPIHVSALPQQLQTSLAIARFHTANFSQLQDFHPQSECACG